jgi:hypothetical protein
MHLVLCRGTMDEVSSHVRLDLLMQDGKAAVSIVPPVLESHGGRCYGPRRRILHSIVADVNRWKRPMQKLNDLNRSLTALEPDGTLIAMTRPDEGKGGCS